MLTPDSAFNGENQEIRLTAAPYRVLNNSKHLLDTRGRDGRMKGDDEESKREARQ